MQPICLASTSRHRPPSRGHVTLATLILAAVSALVLVALSGCHSAPPTTSAFASTPTDKDAEARLRRSDTMRPIQPFDEGFVTMNDEP